MPRRDSGLWTLHPDGSVRPLPPRSDDTPPDGIEQPEHYKVRKAVTNRYEFLLAVGERFGLPVLLLFVVIGFGGYAGWKVIGWSREDQKAFLEAVNANTHAVEALASGQKELVDGQKAQTKLLEDHLREERHH